MHTNGCEINGMYIVEDISRSVMIENKRKIVTTEFVLVHLSVQLAQSPFDMVTKKNTIISIKTIDIAIKWVQKKFPQTSKPNLYSTQLVHYDFRMGKHFLLHAISKKHRSIVFVMMFDNRLHSEVI